MKRNFLYRYGEFTARNPEVVMSAVLIVTVLMAISALNIRVETDFNKSLPQNLEVIKNQNLLSEKFSESSALFLVARLKDSTATENGIKDIRDPRSMRGLQDIEEILRKNPDIETVAGAPDALIAAFGEIPDDIETIKSFFGDSEGLFGSDYSLTTLLIKVNGDAGQERVNRIVNIVEDDIESANLPGSMEFIVTGGPIISKIVSDLIFQDLSKTISIAIVLILIVLIIAYKSPFKGIISVSTLVIAVIWTGGTMQILGIPLSIVTVTVGSLVIGIGIDYGIHILNRYAEEKERRRDDEHKRCRSEAGDYQECMKTCFICYGVTVDKVGTAILGTAITTVASFIALAGSGVPFLTDMGIALSLGIAYAMAVSIFVLPALIVMQEKAGMKIKGWIK